MTSGFFSRYIRSDALAVLRQEQPLPPLMAAGSISGTARGGLLAKRFAAKRRLALPGVILLTYATQTFPHSN